MVSNEARVAPKTETKRRRSLSRKIIVPAIIVGGVIDLGTFVAAIHDHGKIEQRIDVAIGQLAIPYPSQEQLDCAEASKLSSSATQQIIFEAQTLEQQASAYDDAKSAIEAKYATRLHVDESVGVLSGIAGVTEVIGPLLFEAGSYYKKRRSPKKVDY